ncbi:MAG TPA: tripartite tricarboxylate transporter substrate binding protein [Burkholderiales bacterium]|jgi:tripartite-type tricarboxylate transporter receptor subunit TctC|nr:tripartite tricarboxylate transporter substrate binding protein [Burkholderiales bacterium]
MFARIVLAVLAASLAATAAQAQTWPSKPVRYVVPFPPAGATDILARIMAEKLSGPFGQSVVVENRPGAAGNVGTEFVAKSPPDGYTILQLTVAQSISATLYEKLNYGLEKDLIPVAMIALVPNVMIVNPSVPAKSVAEFIALARSRPGRINFASSGSGTSIHMSAEMFKMLTGVNIVHIPYKGSGPALADLMGGQVDVMFDNLTSSIGLIRSGKLRALAVTTSTRYQELPDVPTVQETVPGYEATAWFGIVAPAGTPREVVMRINGEVNRALAHADVKEKLAQQGALARSWTPEEFGSFIHNEVVKWAKVVKASGAKVE